jgi:polar amino acid transport system permease protein
LNYRLEFQDVLAYSDQLAAGTLITLRLSISAMLIGLAIAIPFAAIKNGGPASLRRAVSVYVEAIRNTPLLVQIYLVFFGLPSLGINLTANSAALLAMSLNVGAYATEIIRAGIQSIDKGQAEAGRALGLNRIQVFCFVILKPAIRNVYPALTSQFIILMLFSSLVSAISAEDLTSVANQIQSITFRSFEIYIVITIIYFGLTLLFSSLFALIARVALNYPR